MTLPNPPSKDDQIPNQPFYFPETPATFDRLFGTLVPNIQLDPEPGAGGTWVRPADWLPMPVVYETEQKFVGLFAIYDLPENFIAVYFEGDYTVDWGDGVIQNFSSGETAQHSYAWSIIPSSTLTTGGYRQVLVIVTPQGGQNLTWMDLSVRHINVALTAYGSTPWLDIAVSMPNSDTGTSMILNYYNGINYFYYTCLAEVQRVRIVNAGGMSDFYDYFYFSPKLSLVIIDNCPNADSFEYMFDDCYALTSVSLSDTSSVTNMSNMFYSCTALTSVSLSDTSSVTDMSSMFLICSSLTSVPQLDTSSVTNMDSMFDNCYALTSVSLSDTSKVEDMYNMFAYCSSLTLVSLSDTSLVTEVSQMFINCPSLQQAVMPGTAVNISYRYCLLGRQAIIDIFNGLDNASATIDVRNNYGVSTLTSGDRAIATDKGWTVLY